MKKIGTALLVADMLLCLLLAMGYGFRRGHEWEQAALSDVAQGEQMALSDAAQGEQMALSDAAQEERAAREQQEGTGEWQQEQVQVQEQEIRRIAITFDDEGIIGIEVLPEKRHRRVVYSACAFPAVMWKKWETTLRIVFANVDPFADVFAG